MLTMSVTRTMQVPVLKHIGAPLPPFAEATEEAARVSMASFPVQDEGVLSNHLWGHKTVHGNLCNYSIRLLNHGGT